MSDKPEFVYLNGQFVPADEATVSAFDAGLLHGAGLFETMRSYNGRVFRGRQHLERLWQSARGLRAWRPRPRWTTCWRPCTNCSAATTCPARGCA